MIAGRERERAEDRAPNLVPPAGNPRFPLFDGLRAIAALSVFAGHTVTGLYAFRTHPATFQWSLQLADQGVGIFFLLSGFLLYRPFLVWRRGGHRVDVRSYGVRRFLRIVPAYWVALTVFVAAGFVTGVTIHNWWIFYGYGQIYSSNTLGHGIGAAWTLCVEVTFYILLPMFALLAARLGRGRSFRIDLVMLAVLGAASLAFRAHYSSFLQTAKVSTLAGTFVWFALGMGLAIASVVREDQTARAPLRPRSVRTWPLVSWGVAAVLFVLVHQVLFSWALPDPARAVISHALYGLAALFILLPAVFGAADGGGVRWVLGTRLLAWIGLVSYGFYLYHTIVISQMDDVLPSGPGIGHYLAVTVCSLIVTLLCAAASYYALERPIMRLGRSRTARLSAPRRVV